ncbi:MAG: lysophospholipid acyltransferase family protein [Phycisphaerales bacterium]|nr:lysophospholipid acyltransferase family protein [Phycisphaerales bacterium]
MGQKSQASEPAMVLPAPKPGLRGLPYRLVRPIAGRLLRLATINRHQDEIEGWVKSGRFMPGEGYVRSFKLDVEVSDADLDRIPEEGPLLVTCNHPFGGNDACSVLSLLERRRDDVKILVNELLGCLRFFEGHLILVDVFGDESGKNPGAMREAARHLRGGGALLVMPAGAVSHLDLGKRMVTDAHWSEHVGGLARISRASVLPVHVAGRNSWLFQLLGLIHPVLRTMLLPHEMVRGIGSRVRVRIGDPVPPDRIRRFESSEGLAQYLRALTYLLPERVEDEDAPTDDEQKMQDVQSSWGAVAESATHSGDELQSELDALGSDACLIAQSDLEVWCARAGDIPRLMLEVGRLRETAFRNVGEGSGRALDIDRYDGWYWQLLLWNKKKKELAGGYRLGLTDEIVPGHGIEGLYTHSLFEYGPELIEKITPAIELGRSYVREEYQRRPTSLLLLWRGIGAFIVLHPEYRRLFGPVSISNEFSSMSRHLLIEFLQTHRAMPRLAELVRPRNPIKSRPVGHWDEQRVARAITDPEDLDALVRTIESGRRAMPILLRQYLKLEAKILAANVDEEFGEVLDGLMYADMFDLDRRMMKFFVGTEGMQRFLAHYGEEVAEPSRLRRKRSNRS